MVDTADKFAASAMMPVHDWVQWCSALTKALIQVFLLHVVHIVQPTYACSPVCTSAPYPLAVFLRISDSRNTTRQQMR